MCAPLNYPHEDRHRAELEKPDLPSTERLCHLVKNWHFGMFAALVLMVVADCLGLH